jgi:hypothetical protein
LKDAAYTNHQRTTKQLKIITNVTEGISPKILVRVSEKQMKGIQIFRCEWGTFSTLTVTIKVVITKVCNST